MHSLDAVCEVSNDHIRLASDGRCRVDAMVVEEVLVFSVRAGMDIEAELVREVLGVVLGLCLRILLL